ncbi:TfoX/Sxy family protein [Marivita sp. XM-24bin2]|jgi:DNA transformation protein|uniref:TfoX/Sxy family protein n=1 Tax=unclassified Marivita TaxID=2632480 RepID=UPI000D79301B|nr:TfoX/Sxy family protein [Marivita sp. XM-24bin2]MCR9110378.1 TfoX/Sxy family protein [Paracoccaceae bacterium]PWL36056.1 MAG: TfoX-like protein [Marivita sp. XM-24bin2]
MAVSDEQIGFVRDLFRGLPSVTTRKMFGGLGIYSDGTIFAVIGPGETLLLKARGQLAEDLSAEGCEQWSYEGKSGKQSRMPYWTLPDSALDDPDEACAWARRSLVEVN